MGRTSKEKNIIDGGTISAEGNVNIGDRKIVNIYGMEASQKEIKAIAKIFIGLLVFFGIAAIVLVYWPNPDEKLASFFCGAFFALCLYFLVVLIRTSRQPSIDIK